MEKKNEKILILDFGGQYTQLIARRVREQHIYSEVIPFNTDSKKIKEMQPSGIILSGGPASVEQDGAPFCDPGIFALGIPVLGICYGMQLTAKMLGGKVKKAKDREYGRTEILPEDKNGLLKDTKDATACWMSHTWQVTEVPSGFKVTGISANCPVVVMEDRDRRIYGVQFHPEVTHTEEGKTILRNFLYEVCGCMGDWTMDAYLETAVAAIRKTVGEEKVLLALSGGVDSAVTAALIQRAIGDNLVCVFVDHGLLRKNESEQVCSIFQDLFPVRFV
ncbi:MAG: glutamine-hydrolyzing GMP synthase, partial [Erysipelotrichaceae bacterium]|nr:glutamine-hydrolyzing GMP synthase [Erysipelotrichaceae bacterium]